MYNFKRSLFALLGLLLLVCVVAAITPFKGYGQESPDAATVSQDVRVVNSTANPVPTKIVNGITAPVPAKIVNASSAPVQIRDVDGARASNIVTLFSSGDVFRKELPDGTFSSNEYAVPVGQVLIVTDVEWSVFRSPAYSDTGVTLRLYISGHASIPIYTSHLFVDSNNQGASSESMETGFTVAHGAKIQISGLGGHFYIDSVILHGYLVPAS